jgi:hypothetical protein
LEYTWFNGHADDVAVTEFLFKDFGLEDTTRPILNVGFDDMSLGQFVLLEYHHCRSREI